MVFLKKFTPFIISYIIINILIWLFAKSIENQNTSTYVLYISNFFFMCLSLLSVAIQQKALKNTNPNIFIRSVMTGMILKMFSTAIALVIYFLSSGNNFNKRGVFVSLFFYLIYLTAEVLFMMKLNKKKDA